ncbi:hypothetical protein [Roseomonas sp. AR75]|uniref:hypothetical protein n=1 Tax=Roseomonas sp. AR75 TaxID=2562311 RepID=UPI001F0EC56B|nr:hypothetical protein [Roseomonas sp. AR75]
MRTPAALNAHFAASGRDAVLVPMQVRAEELAAVVAALSRVENFGGIVVTVPHKEAIVALCDRLTEAARIVGAGSDARWSSPIQASLPMAVFDATCCMTARRRPSRCCGSARRATARRSGTPPRRASPCSACTTSARASCMSWGRRPASANPASSSSAETATPRYMARSARSPSASG